MADMQITIQARGPLFDGTAKDAVDAYLNAAAREVAREGEQRIGLQLIRVLKKPTGFYESRIRTDQIGYATQRVNDSNVIYGPWLEGVGSRNKTTRFKGYATFRLVKQGLERDAATIAERALPEYLERSR